MGHVRSLMRIGYRQVGNIAKLLLGRRLTCPPLVSATLDKDDVAIARRWLRDRSNWHDPGTVRQYEDEFARWNSSRYALAFMGGRVALSACIHALGLRPGDEVILPGYTCVVVPNAFRYAGVEPVYSDIELETYGLDAGLIEEKITSRTKAIMLHHLYGLVCRDYEVILDLARSRGLKVIEDCAQSTGALFKGIRVGNYGDIAFYSSEHSKAFSTIQGGMATTNDDGLAKGLKEYYEHAPYPDDELIEKQLYNVILDYYLYKHPHRWFTGDIASYLYKDKLLISTSCEEECGIKPEYYGQRMPSPIAAIGRNQLGKLDHYNQQRRESAERWAHWCERRGYEKPIVIPGSIPIHLRYPVMVAPEKKRDTSWAQEELGVRLGVWFVSNIHPSSMKVAACPNADRAVKRCINFPGVFE